jgi:glycosyltransferase involved in cell wall biosynthesis
MMKRLSIFFFGPLPPPTHGMAVVNAQMISLLGHYGKVRVANTSPGGLVRNAEYHVRKSARVLWALMRLLPARLAGCRVVYGSPDDGWGGIWTAFLVLAGRILGMRVTLHHHSYRYLVKPTAVMKAITKFAGSSARHVVLGDDMGQRLVSLYPEVKHIVSCENSVAVPPILPVAAQRKHIAIGILANLSADKGALLFLDSFQAMLDAGLDVSAILAGPIVDPDVQAAIEQAQWKNGNKIVALNGVSGDAKERFFQDIDLFLFPTQYKTEAFPLVLMESLVRGVPVLTYRRGCIGALEGQTGVELVDVGSDFTQPAIEAVRRLGRWNHCLRADVAAAALVRNADNLARLEGLAAEICGSPDLAE